MSEIVNCNQCVIGRVVGERCTRCGVEQPAPPEPPKPAPVKPKPEAVIPKKAPEPVKKPVARKAAKRK